MKEEFIVQSYTKGKKGRLFQDSPMLARSVDHARMLAQRLAVRKALVVAFARKGDPETGDWDEPRLIDAFGDVPEEVSEMERV